MPDTKVITVENELFDMWKNCFGDDKRVISSFFDCVYDSSHCISERIDGKIASALYLLPCDYHRKKCFYLYAAATLPEFRKQGIMARLVGRAREEAMRSGAAFIYLYPAEYGLYSYYEKLGFSQLLTAGQVDIKTSDISETGEIHLCNINEFYEILKENARFFNAPVPERRVLPYISEITSNARFSYCVKNGRVCALASCEIKNGKAVSLYADAADGCFGELLASFRTFGSDSCNIIFPAHLSPGARTVRNGMLMAVNGSVAGQAKVYTGFNML